MVEGQKPSFRSLPKWLEFENPARPRTAGRKRMRLLKKFAPWRHWVSGEDVTRVRLIAGCVRLDCFLASYSSGRPQRSRRLPAGDELDKPFEILGGRRQVELFRHIPALWHRLLGRPASENGRLRHGDRGAGTGRPRPEG